MFMDVENKKERFINTLSYYKNTKSKITNKTIKLICRQIGLPLRVLEEDLNYEDLRLLIKENIGRPKRDTKYSPVPVLVEDTQKAQAEYQRSKRNKINYYQFR